MKAAQLSKPTRVRVDSPSTLQPYHKYHGLIGIAVLRTSGEVTIHFTDGPVYSMSVNPLYLVDMEFNKGEGA